MLIRNEIEENWYETQPVTIAAMTDLHLDIMHDGMMRIDAFLDAAQKADVDFIIQLGDFSYPKDTSTCLCAPEKMPINLKYAWNVRLKYQN